MEDKRFTVLQYYLALHAPQYLTISVSQYLSTSVYQHLSTSVYQYISTSDLRLRSLSMSGFIKYTIILINPKSNSAKA